ncbi:MAG: glycosyltransferase family 2 protein [Desulfurella sp.]|jgi:rhamnosyltransferase
MDVSVVIPTLNAQDTITALLLRLRQEDIKDIIVIDSSSKDNTQKIAKAFTDNVYIIEQKEFNHGLVRNFGLSLAKFNTVVFLTQDAILCKGAISRLVKKLDQQDVAIAFGRQLPKKNAKAFSKHLRLFNYPNYSIKKTLLLKKAYGVRLAFNSNSFSAYKKDIIQSLDGFPKLDFGEDVYMAAKVLLAGYAVYYDSKACVYHSHNYSLKEEFNRYLAVGKFYKSQKWITEAFGKTSKEGFKYIADQLSFLFESNNLILLPEFLLKDLLKFIAYKIA